MSKVPSVARLPVRTLTVVQEQGPNEMRCLVRCPMQGRSVDATGCATCARMQSVEWSQEHAGAVTCRLDAPPAPPNVPSAGVRMDFAEAAVRTALHEVAPRGTLCVRASTSARKTRTVLIAYDLDAIPVVDDDLRVLGIVTRGDLGESGQWRTAADFMCGGDPIGLPENAPIAHAIALMAYERVNHVPIVTEDGELVSMWDATSALRWTAERMGYVGP